MLMHGDVLAGSNPHLDVLKMKIILDRLFAGVERSCALRSTAENASLVANRNGRSRSCPRIGEHRLVYEIGAECCSTPRPADSHSCVERVRSTRIAGHILHDVVRNLRILQSICCAEPSEPPSL